MSRTPNAQILNYFKTNFGLADDTRPARCLREKHAGCQPIKTLGRGGDAVDQWTCSRSPARKPFLLTGHDVDWWRYFPARRSLQSGGLKNPILMVTPATARRRRDHHPNGKSVR